MALLLHIDTATEHASVCLAGNGVVLASESNPSQKDHASFIQPAIQRVMTSAQQQFSAIDAIAVSNGPGSYTGLRVGLSTAKGLCYALNKPLILINTLEIMATAAFATVMELSSQPGKPVLYCPMIDARRMEVFTAVYKPDLTIVLSPTPVILNEGSFNELLQQYEIYFFGSGAAKWRGIVKHSNATFIDAKHDAGHMHAIAEKMYLLKSFADLAYSEPFYLKEFFTSTSELKSD